jgi:hypothetical protein
MSATVTAIEKVYTDRRADGVGALDHTQPVFGGVFGGVVGGVFGGVFGGL